MHHQRSAARLNRLHIYSSTFASSICNIYCRSVLLVLTLLVAHQNVFAGPLNGFSNIFLRGGSSSYSISTFGVVKKAENVFDVIENQNNITTSNNKTMSSITDYFYSDILRYDGSKKNMTAFMDWVQEQTKTKVGDLFSLVRWERVVVDIDFCDQVVVTPTELLCARVSRGGDGSTVGRGQLPSSLNSLRVNNEFNEVDVWAKKIAVGLGIYTLTQTIGKIFTHDDFYLLGEFASKFLSVDTARAVQEIRKILSKFEDELGVIDVFSKYPTLDVIISLQALSRLQQSSIEHAKNQVKKKGFDAIPIRTATNDDTSNVKPEKGRKSFPGKDVISDLAHYSVFASVAYGWKGSLAIMGKFHWGNLKALLKRTNIRENDIIEAKWNAATHRPAYFLVRDIRRKNLVLSIRGTLSAKDVLTDLCATAEDFDTFESESENGENGRIAGAVAGESQPLRKNKIRSRAHYGMIEAARSVSRMTQLKIAKELASSGDTLVIVGHSLGGGTAAVLGTMWRNTFPGLKVYTYGCPCVGPFDCYPVKNNDVVSVIVDGDPFSTLSLGHVADLTVMVSELCKDKVLRDEVLQRTEKRITEMTENDLAWCSKKYNTFRGKMKGDLLYPPGNSFIINRQDGNRDCIDIRQVSHTDFNELHLSPRMLDLSRHNPNRYEALLQELFQSISNSNCHNVNV